MNKSQSKYKENLQEPYLVNSFSNSFDFNHPKIDIYENCLIVKTICNILDFKDDCFYLNIIRYLKNNTEINDYNLIEQDLSNKILNDNQSKVLSDLLINTFVKHLVFSIDNNDIRSAINDYKLMILFLKQRYNIVEKAKILSK